MTTQTFTIKQAYGKELNFISIILKDGYGTESCENKSMAFLDNELFVLNRLSLSKNTWIASGFNSYVVKLKTL